MISTLNFSHQGLQIYLFFVSSWVLISGKQRLKLSSNVSCWHFEQHQASAVCFYYTGQAEKEMNNTYISFWCVPSP